MGVVPLRAVSDAGTRRGILLPRFPLAQVTPRQAAAVPYRGGTFAEPPCCGGFFSPLLTSPTFVDVWRDGGGYATVWVVARLGKGYPLAMVWYPPLPHFPRLGPISGPEWVPDLSDAFRPANRLSVTPVQKFGLLCPSVTGNFPVPAMISAGTLPSSRTGVAVMEMSSCVDERHHVQLAACRTGHVITGVAAVIAWSRGLCMLNRPATVVVRQFTDERPPTSVRPRLKRSRWPSASPLPSATGSPCQGRRG